MAGRIKAHQDFLRTGGPEQERLKPIEPEYGVSHDGDEISIALGVVPAFVMPKADAVKLALLILHHAGIQVDHG